MNRVAIIGPGIIPRRFGFTPAEKRSVKSMPAWVKDIVPKPTGKNETVKSGQEDVEADTMPLIKSKVYRTLYQTKKLAARLKGDSLEETARNDWQFVFDYVRYVKDATNAEQVRSPRRTIYEAKGDCDCFTVLLSSLLINQRIPHFLRIMKQNGSNHWSHIYIVVPVDGTVSKKLTERSQYIVMDCVTNKFDFEPPFTGKKDYAMSLQYLDGIKSASGYGSLGECTTEKKPYVDRMRQFVYAAEVQARGFIPTEVFLKENGIAFQPAIDKQTESGSFLIKTAAGEVKDIPTIITKEQADQVLQMVKGYGTQAVDQVKQQAAAFGIKPNKNWLWWLLLGGGVLLVASSSGKNKSVAVPSLGAVKDSPKSKKKLKTLTI